MRRIGLLRIAVLALAGVLAVHADADRPNFIFIMADDMGYSGLSCYDNASGIKTPHLDRMAANGVKFTDFHSNGAVCSPTRAALLSGRYQQRTGITSVVKAKECRNQGLALEEFTIAEMLKSGGYRTALFGKWHVGYSTKFNPVKQGFDEFIGFVSGNVDYQSHLDLAQQEDWWKQDQLTPEEGYQTTLIGSHALDFMERNQKNPFFLYVAFGAPHSPFQGPGDPAVRGAGSVKQSEIDMECAYREMIESMDAEVGRICTKLEELGLVKNTFIFFCSDNGPAKEWSKSADLKGGKGSMSEGGHRVPGIAFWPGTIPPAVTGETAMILDFYTTYAALSGTPVPEQVQLDGVDLSPLLFNGEKLPVRTLYWSKPGAGAARRGPWKYFPQQKGALYNLDTDLAETTDVSAQHPEIVQQLKAEYVRWDAEVNANPTGPAIDPDISATPPKGKSK
ncbi:sulfatase-like hydrolase/transferase [Pontiella sulfatireligans]|uniref:Arylsulfatase n=1 Tax=Pontiella sulfatireligans TaxID=2750658 RepID=A0A6C2UF98_9BACT|nr:sulfatase-like hydrolase/transferase [Pontiella sulfatireligans]SPS74201.1 sulfatase S1_62 [Kiritimatiellales bacterium]VGO18599.1 Arylsulfatase [Pontiella sulfatireligans]